MIDKRPRPARPHRRRVPTSSSSSAAREPNLTELGIFSVMWSEHCSYKSSRVHLKKLPTEGERVVQGPGENAGIIDIGGRPGRRLQDRIAQPPLLHRALPGRGHGRRRHPPRHLHHGRPADRPPRIRCASARSTNPRNRSVMEGVVAGHRRLTAIPSASRPSAARSISIDCYYLNPLVNVFCLGLADKDKIFLRQGRGRRQPGPLRRVQGRAATASTGRPWPRPSSARRPSTSGRTSRSATRSRRSSSSRPVSRSWTAASSSASRTWAPPA